MENNSLIGVMTAALVTVLLLGMCLVPFVNDIAYTTTTIENEGAGELRYAYYDEPTTYTTEAVYDSVANEITLGDSQTVTATEVICYASDVASVIYTDGGFTLLYDNEGTMTAVDLGESYTLSEASGGVTITGYGLSPIVFDEVSWEYVPSESGSFGNFTEGRVTIKNSTVAAMGVFAGVECANDFSSSSDLVMTETVTDGVFEDATWSQE